MSHQILGGLVLHPHKTIIKIPLLQFFMVTAQEKLFEKIKSLVPIIEIEEKKEGNTTSIKRKEFVTINNNKINFYNLKAHLDTIQKRNYLNKFCLSEISQDCENKKISSKEEKQSLEKENNNYLPNLIIQCEYFLFSTKTIFDTIFDMIKYVFPEKEHGGFGNIEKWKKGEMINDLIGGNLDWLIKFNKLRNILTHDTIAGLSTNFNHDCEKDILTYSKRNLSIRNKNEQTSENFQLPDYLEECFSKTNEVINRFYELLLNQKIEGNKVSL